MHGRDGDYWKRSLHMCTRGSVSVAGGFSKSNSYSFSKDGRKIRVGDCAFFKPPRDSPPFIGIIRCLITGKESSLKFTVNWLYRASEVELEKGIQLEAVPNEIFYSFHEDEVPAASLLHQCKVAFLPKGVDLRSGTSSFICRRVYDTSQKCLWWLTDQNYIDKRQEEVDHLISKTRIEMHATIQPGGRSPKTTNGAAPASQMKAGSEGAQNVSSFSSHVKGKKRERSDPDSETVKRLHKIGDIESCQLKSENVLKAEIARITDRGGLVNYESVDKLIQLMVPDKADKKIDLTGRSMLAGVVAATDKFDCLSWFVQLKGLPVFDEWLQEIHKGKIGDGNSHKDGDRSVEEFLLVLLRALEKLPVNLQSLQMCNIGKSVNHLRSHKNLEIQRKARSLVDTWKKRVEAEMNNDDGKHGSNMGVAWHGRHTSEPPQSGHRNSGCSENAVKSSSSHLSAPRIVLPKPAQGDTQTTASTSPGYSKSDLSPAAGGVNSKDDQPKTAAVGESPDHPLTSVKDEKSSSSSESSSSDHIKTAESSGKEDPRSSTAGSTGIGERLRRTARPRKPVGGLPGLASRGIHKDGDSHLSPSYKHVGSEKISSHEKMHDVPVVDGNSQKLIVKIPNRARSPAVSGNGGSVNGLCPSNSRATSPTCSDKHEKPDKGDASQLNDVSDVTTKSWHSSDLKEVLAGSDEADGSSAANHDEVHSTNGDHTRNMNELPKVAPSSAAHETKPWKTHEPSFTSMNALVESCVKHSEANALISAVDDVGINLLASVAANEMSKCDSVATNSPGNTAVAEDSYAGNAGRSLNVDEAAQDLMHCSDSQKQDIEKQAGNTSLVKNGRDGISSTNEKLASDSSNSDLLKKQDGGQSSGVRDMPSNVVSMEFALDNKVGNHKETDVLSVKEKHEEVVKKVLRGTPVELSNDGFANRASEVVGSGVHVKNESKSTTQSDAIEANDKIQNHLGPRTLLDSEMAIGNGVDAEKLVERKNVIDSNSQSYMEQHQNKTESHSGTLGTTEKDNKTGGLGSATADCSQNYKDRSAQNEEALGHCNGSSYLNNITKLADCPSTDASRASKAGMEMLRFDLNEGFMADEVKYEEPKTIVGVSCPATLHLVSPLPFSAVSKGLPASVTIAAAAKGAFIPPDDLLWIKGELGWKGSAATSAFRPAEPRKILESQVNISTPPSDAPSKSSRPFLNIDLNAPDDAVQDEMMSNGGTGCLIKKESNTPARGFGGLDLDLNQMDEATEVGQYSAVTNPKLEVPGLPFKHVNISNGESSGLRNFDLNDGPMLEEVGEAPSTLGQNVWCNMPSQPPVVGFHMNNTEIGNFASWFPPGSAISGVTVPAGLPDRGDKAFSVATTGTSQRMYYTPPGNTPFAPDVFRGPVLSSSPALSFPSAPYQYPMFPFGSSFPVPSATLSGSTTYMDSLPGGMHNLPTSHSQYLGHPGVVSSSYPRPYLISIPDGRSIGGQENSSRWGSHSLDLNSGPRSIEVESKNDPSPFASRQFSVPSSPAFTEEQMRMFQASGVVLKRKEPDGGWDAEKAKQQSWH